MAGRELRTARMVQQVARRSREIDVDLLNHQSLVEQLGVAAVHLLEQPGDSTETTFTLDDLKAGRVPDDWRKSARYDQDVSFAYPVNVGAPDAPTEQLAEDIRRLGPLRHDLRRVYSGAYGDPPPGEPPTVLRSRVDRGQVPVPWVYVGLQSGLITNSPGNAVYSSEFDTRKRPWYTMVLGKHGAQWGPPVPDDSGLGSLVPCSTALYGSDGQFLGVAGIANGLAYLVDKLMISDLSPQTDGFIVEPKGGVVVRTGDELSKRVDAGLYGNVADALVPFPNADLIARLASGEEAGTIDSDDGVLVFDRLESLGWWYVVRVDPDKFAAWDAR